MRKAFNTDQNEWKNYVYTWSILPFIFDYKVHGWEVFVYIHIWTIHLFIFNTDLNGQQVDHIWRTLWKTSATIQRQGWWSNNWDHTMENPKTWIKLIRTWKHKESAKGQSAYTRQLLFMYLRPSLIFSNELI